MKKTLIYCADVITRATPSVSWGEIGDERVIEHLPRLLENGATEEV